MTIQAIRGAVEAAIQKASQATGVDFSFLMKTANRESGLNPSAKSGSSSAAGLFQFVEQTWLSTLKQYGTKHGYGQYADAITKGSDGRYHVSGQGVRQAVMNLRLDPHASSMMAGELASDAAAYLKGRTGRNPTSGELYAAHFLGPQGSARLIEAVQTRPGATAAHIFPDAAQANHSIFYKDGRAATVSEVYANLTRTGGSDAVAVSAAPQEGFIHTASTLGDDRERRQEALISLVLQGTHPSETAGVGGRLTGSLFTSEMLKMLSDSRHS
jgi:hypothetical protein